MTSPWLVLFDIDGTLLLSGRAGVRGLRVAVDQLYGHGDAVDGVSMAGRTDRAIVAEVLSKIGRAADDEDRPVVGVGILDIAGAGGYVNLGQCRHRISP